jgi:hypothetical protein
MADELTLSDFSQVRLANGERLYISRKPVALSTEVFHLIHFFELSRKYAVGYGGRAD